VRGPAELLDDPHLNDVALFETNFTEPSLVKRSLRMAMNVEDVDRAADQPPPLLGADTESVLRAAGCTDAEIAAARPQKR
jgi:crotonobetainyl-CoA:carnitine CoA-transferase CaiB-like acyl-CoA transferase